MTTSSKIAELENLKHAFQLIQTERQRGLVSSMDALIERARARYPLTAAQIEWIRWSLDRQAVALQSKEPSPMP